MMPTRKMIVSGIEIARRMKGLTICFAVIFSGALPSYSSEMSPVAFGRTGDVYSPSILGSPVVSGNHVFVGASDGYLHVVDFRTGEGVEKHNLGTPVSSSPAVSGNAVVVSGLNGMLYTFVSK